MNIQLQDIGRRFGRDWIFRHISQDIPSNSHTLIVGRNGSGKSTLLQIISGFLSPSEGSISFAGAEQLDSDLVSLAAPYLDVYDDLTLSELVSFHLRFRSLRNEIDKKRFIDILQLTPHSGKRIANFSSGMRQRVRLGLAILTHSELLLLDGPTSNLDREAIQWFRELLEEHSKERSVIVSSNHQPDDYLRADLTIDVGEFHT